jgi:hypothetical protein
MKSILDLLATPVAPASNRRCPICGGAVVLVTSRKHRRARCAACGLDVPLWPQTRSAAARDVAEVALGPARAEGRRRDLRPSLSRGIVRSRVASVA